MKRMLRSLKALANFTNTHRRAALLAVLLGGAVSALCFALDWSLSELLIAAGLCVSLFVAGGWIVTFLLEQWNLFSAKKVFVRHLYKLRKRFPDRAQIGLLALGAAVALHALSYYRQQTTFNILTALESRDSAARASYLQGDGVSPYGTHLMKIFAELPEAIDVEEDDDCTPAIRQKIWDWERKYFVQAAGYDPKNWKSASELFKIVWSSDKMRQDESVRARAMVMHAIDFLYIVHDALHAYQIGYFTKAETGMWTGYIDDLTPSPFFLLALVDGAAYPYMMPNIAKEIRRYYMQDDKAEIRCVINTVYPEFLEKERKFSLFGISIYWTAWN
jgi:hypothetical protein